MTREAEFENLWVKDWVWEGMSLCGCREEMKMRPGPRSVFQMPPFDPRTSHLVALGEDGTRMCLPCSANGSNSQHRRDRFVVLESQLWARLLVPTPAPSLHPVALGTYDTSLHFHS